jgi:hypothetical protein
MVLYGWIEWVVGVGCVYLFSLMEVVDDTCSRSNEEGEGVAYWWEIWWRWRTHPNTLFFFCFFCSLMEVDDEILFCRDVFSFLHSGNLSLYFVNDVSRVFVGLVSEIDSKNLIFLSYWINLYFIRSIEINIYL